MSSALPAGLEVMRTTARCVSLACGYDVEVVLTLGLEGDVDVLEHLHGVRATALLLGVEEDVALLGHGAVDHVEEDGAEGLLHVRADPDQEPVVELDSRGQHSTDTGARADGNATLEEVGEVWKTGELCDLVSAGVDAWQQELILTFISRV